MSQPARTPRYASAEEFSISELFHENSKLCRSDPRVAERIVAVLGDPFLQGIMATAFKQYPSARRFSLRVPFPAAVTGFDEALLSRRSFREFSGQAMTLPELAKILHLSAGVTGTGQLPAGAIQYFRSLPSGGGLFPTEMYVYAHRVEDLPMGLYHYYPIEPCLESIREGDFVDQFDHLTVAGDLRQASVILTITGIPLKSRLKYGERGYRFTMLEAGHLAQNLLLSANSLGLGAFPVGGFIDDELDRLLDIDGLDEVALYMLAAGRK